MTIQLHAQPYDTSAAGFYFDSVEDYEAKFDKRLPVEEYEIQFINGDDSECTLYHLVDPCQSSLDKFFDLVEMDLTEDQITALSYLMDNCGYDLEEGLKRFEEVQIFQGTKTEYAEQIVDECYNLEGIAKDYFDYEKYANDLDLGGDICEIDNRVWCVNANEF